jgi:hypothetical protein
MSEHEDERDRDDEPEGDVGIVGGGGPAGTLPEQPGPGDEERHRPDTDH